MVVMVGCGMVTGCYGGLGMVTGGNRSLWAILGL